MNRQPLDVHRAHAALDDGCDDRWEGEERGFCSGASERKGRRAEGSVTPDKCVPNGGAVRELRCEPAQLP